MLNLSFNLLLFAFFAFLTATVFFALSLAKQRKEQEHKQTKASKWGLAFSLLGLALSLGYFLLDGRFLVMHQ